MAASMAVIATTKAAVTSMTATDTIRIRRIWNDSVLLVDAAQGVTVEAAGELLAIDMTAPPEFFVFEMQIFDAVTKAPAVQPAEVDLERVSLLRLRHRDLYEGPLAASPWTEKSGVR